MPLTCEEIYIKKIENGIRGIKMGTKTPEEVQVGHYLAKLKPLNPMMYEDLLEKYAKVAKEKDKKVW